MRTLDWELQLDRTSVVRRKRLSKMCSQGIAYASTYTRGLRGLITFAVHCGLHILFLYSVVEVPRGM